MAFDSIKFRDKTNNSNNNNSNDDDGDINDGGNDMTLEDTSMLNNMIIYFLFTSLTNWSIK